MANNLPTLSSFDLESFKITKTAIEQAASRLLAEKIEQVKTLLDEIKDISEETGVKVNLRSVVVTLSTVRDITEDSWYSSSDNC